MADVTVSGLSLDIHCAGERDFSLQLRCVIPSDRITAVCGPSGSGKTTLLDCVAGLREPGANGHIHFNGRRWHESGRTLPAWQRNIGYVFSDARLFPHLDVAGNLAYASARSAGRAGPSEQDVIAWLELRPLLAQRPHTLSGGQRQRVAIARALLSAPQLLLLDEPLANLDDAASQHCLRCLQRLAGELALPMLYVSHAIEEVTQLADELLLLDAGRLAEHGSLLQLSGRIDTRLAQDERAAAILSAHILRHDDAFGLTELQVEGQTLYVNHLPQAPGSARRVRIPARDVSLCRHRPDDSSILNILPVTVRELQHTQGAHTLVRLALGSQYLLARITRKSALGLRLARGDQLFAQIKSAGLLMEANDPP
ncbi:MAG: molybdenum ABC transporter ATP-binding protein [Halioglobus sp.]